MTGRIQPGLAAAAAAAESPATDAKKGEAQQLQDAGYTIGALVRTQNLYNEQYNNLFGIIKCPQALEKPERAEVYLFTAQGIETLRVKRDHLKVCSHRCGVSCKSQPGNVRWIRGDDGSLRLVHDARKTEFDQAEGSADRRLLDASKRGDLEQVLQALEQGAHIDTSDEEGQTALQWALNNDHMVLARFLVSLGACAVKQNRFNRLALSSISGKSARKLDGRCFLEMADGSSRFFVLSHLRSVYTELLKEYARPVLEGGNVLAVGCGSGEEVFSYPAEILGRCTFSEPEKKDFDRLQSNFPQFPCLQLGIEDLNGEDFSAKNRAVISSNVFCYFTTEEMQSHLGVLSKTLEPGGYLILFNEKTIYNFTLFEKLRASKPGMRPFPMVRDGKPCIFFIKEDVLGAITMRYMLASIQNGDLAQMLGGRITKEHLVRTIVQQMLTEPLDAGFLYHFFINAAFVRHDSEKSYFDDILEIGSMQPRDFQDDVLRTLQELFKDAEPEIFDLESFYFKSLERGLEQAGFESVFNEIPDLQIYGDKTLYAAFEREALGEKKRSQDNCVSVGFLDCTTMGNKEIDYPGIDSKASYQVQVRPHVLIARKKA